VPSSISSEIRARGQLLGRVLLGDLLLAATELDLLPARGEIFRERAEQAGGGGGVGGHRGK
jgi:hypothetical protein